MTDRRSMSSTNTLPANPAASDDPLAGTFAKALNAGALDPVQAAFLAQMAEDYRPEETPALDAAALTAALADFWAFAGETPGADPAIRVARAGGYDCLDIVQPDSPFLVHSVMAEIAEAGLPVVAMFHAVIDVARDAAGRRLAKGASRPESMIQVLLEPMAKDQASALLQRLRVTLADVRLAVGDYAAMLEMTNRAIGELDARAGDLPADELAEYRAFLAWMRDNNFIFLGARMYEYPRTPDGGYAAEEPSYTPDGSLGVLRDQQRGVLRRSS
jgi:glutamate dehydrogenase